MRRIVLAVVMVATLATAASAGVKKRQTAQLLAGVGTGVSGALIITSFLIPPTHYGEVNEPLFYSGLASSVITPSLGHWYVGRYFTLGMAVRLAAAGLGIYAVQAQYETITCPTAHTSADTCKQVTEAGLALLIVAGIAYVGGAAYDLRDAPDAVDRYNRDHAVFITPTAMRDASGTPALGIALGGRF
jgi:hypothetical protein